MDSPIIEALDESVRRRIESNLQHYAPFLAMLTAWKQAIEADLEAAEQRVLRRIAGQNLPLGDWRFPAQTLAVPQEPRLRDWDTDTSLYDPLSGVEWIPCGRGWTLPTQLGSVRVLRRQNQPLLLIELQVVSPIYGQDVVTQQRGQLLFVAGDEELVELLSQSRWFVQQPRGEFVSASAVRYDGFLDFERELAVARWTQRHLEAWLPPFYPYSRKFLHIHLAQECESLPVPAGLGECPANTLRLLAVLDEKTASQLNRNATQSMFFPNAIPLIQASCMHQRLVDIPFEVGEQSKATFAGILNCFCAVAYRDSSPLRARFEVEDAPDESMVESLLKQRLGTPVSVYCDTDATSVKLYFNTSGEEIARPSFLETAREARFTVPFPPTGAFNFSASETSSEGLHYYLYHALLRPAMLTEGDIHEILRHIPSARQMFDLSATRIEVSIEDYPLSVAQPWHNYLWPSVIGDAPLIERQIREMACAGVFITPVLRLCFTPLPHNAELPQFLLQEAARHAAAVVSQFFQIGMYIVQGEVA